MTNLIEDAIRERQPRTDLTDLNMEQAMTGNVIPLRRTYEARLERFEASGLNVHIAGTLDGFIDFAVVDRLGQSATYSLTLDDARRIIAGLHAVVGDVQANCLYDRDALLR